LREKEMKANKWGLWWDSLPAHTRDYLKAQPIWHTKDLCFFGAIAFVAGMGLGALLTL